MFVNSIFFKKWYLLKCLGKPDGASDCCFAKFSLRPSIMHLSGFGLGVLDVILH